MPACAQCSQVARKTVCPSWDLRFHGTGLGGYGAWKTGVAEEVGVGNGELRSAWPGQSGRAQRTPSQGWGPGCLHIPAVGASGQRVWVRIPRLRTSAGTAEMQLVI